MVLVVYSRCPKPSTDDCIMHIWWRPQNHLCQASGVDTHLYQASELVISYVHCKISGKLVQLAFGDRRSVMYRKRLVVTLKELMIINPLMCLYSVFRYSMLQDFNVWNAFTKWSVCYLTHYICSPLW